MKQTKLCHVRSTTVFLLPQHLAKCCIHKSLMSPGGFSRTSESVTSKWLNEPYLFSFCSRYSQPQCCFNCKPETNKDQVFFEHAQPALVCSDKKFLQEPRVILTKQITIICFTGCTNNWEADVYQPSVDYWKYSDFPLRGKNNQLTLVKENDSHYENTDYVHDTPSAHIQNRQMALLMPPLIISHILICTSTSISPWITSDIAASFIKPLGWHLVQIKLH